MMRIDVKKRILSLSFRRRPPPPQVVVFKRTTKIRSRFFCFVLFCFLSIILYIYVYHPYMYIYIHIRCKIITCIILTVPFFAVQLLLMITFFFHSGDLRGVEGWHVNSFISCTCVLVFVLLVMISYLFLKHKREHAISKIKNGRKSMSCLFACWTFGMMLLSEIGLGLVVPTSSLLPLNMFNNHDTLKSSSDLPTSCTQSVVHDRWNAVKEYYNESRVDFSDVNLVTGGLPGHFGNAGAMVIDQTIYLAKDTCPSIDLLIHEVVHIWQFQTSWWFGSTGPSRFFEWQIGQLECRSCPSRLRW